MSHWRSFGLAIFAAFCLLGEATGSARAQCNPCATEWSHSKATNLGGLPGIPSSQAESINEAGQAVGFSGNDELQVGTYAIEWSGGKVIDLGGLPGFMSSMARGINDAGQVVGASLVGATVDATEWSGGKVIDLGPGEAVSTNNVGQAVGLGPDGQSPPGWRARRPSVAAPRRPRRRTLAQKSTPLSRCAWRRCLSLSLACL
jgi:probable HAF family extracellular repeat protein